MTRLINHSERMTLRILRNTVKQSEVFNVHKEKRFTQERVIIQVRVIKEDESQEVYQEEYKQAA